MQLPPCARTPLPHTSTVSPTATPGTFFPSHAIVRGELTETVTTNEPLKLGEALTELHTRILRLPHEIDNHLHRRADHLSD